MGDSDSSESLVVVASEGQIDFEISNFYYGWVFEVELFNTLYLRQSGVAGHEYTVATQSASDPVGFRPSRLQTQSASDPVGFRPSRLQTRRKSNGGTCYRESLEHN